MANPQVENGHVRIADDLFEALMRTRFSDYESRILRAVIRLTYGWRKKLAAISNTRLEAMTGIDRRNCVRVINKLSKRRILTVSYVDGTRLLGFEKDYDQWESSVSTANGHSANGDSANGGTTNGRTATTAGVCRDTSDGGQVSEGQSVPGAERQYTDSTPSTVPLRGTERKRKSRGARQSPEAKKFAADFQEYQQKRGRDISTFEGRGGSLWRVKQAAIAEKLLKGGMTVDEIWAAVHRFEGERGASCEHLSQLADAIGRWQMRDKQREGGRDGSRQRSPPPAEKPGEGKFGSHYIRYDDQGKRIMSSVSRQKGDPDTGGKGGTEDR